MAKPEVRDMKRSFVAGIGGLALIAFVVYIAFNAQGGISSLPLVPKFTVKAAFKNTDSLQANDLVRQGSIRIGSVASVDYQDGQSIVTMRLDNADSQFYKNATAAIWDLNALGSKFVELTPGTPDAGVLGDDVIPTTHTEDSYDLHQVLSIFDDKTKLATQQFLGQVGGGMVNQADNFHAFLSTSDKLLPDLGTTSTALVSQQAELPALLASADRLTGRFKDREAEISSLIAQTNSTFEAFNVDNDLGLGQTLDRAPATLDSAKRALDDLDHPLADTESTMRDFRPGAQSLADSEKDLRGVLREGISPLHKVPDVADKARPALGDLKDAFSDARPLAPRLAKTFEMASTPLRIIEPYAPEAGQLFVRLASFVSMGSSPGNRYAYINVNPSLGTLTSATTGSCNIAQNNYPKPGQATADRKGFGMPSGTPCLTKTPPPLSAALHNMSALTGGHK